ncbi:hypothetical protein ESY86_15020 [Subsaximicrobium wynnwilliamsii]|uniref:Uncharacterized protein n=1 Tax=Subsaximicrobium wynnwilliamsii TaxID=291179 RepID=A0A5C6ZH68_9FLAO|nr:hypothetical protein [Subsaximicrobium wynnwilliamsii]TXD82341.1 hypothetical protein ESY87_14610 [Subsaximicrobium wynnwilliamsii]TXD87979.1 hypothetical protein ESY86_15020 [Subsaximicrobium wynnwilliamsii]TXE01972.1 hypothetical protein ESY88_14185 [Subsaximicrobium wynnwilliamsii]
MENDILALLFYCVPAAITGAVAYYFFKEHVSNEDKRRDYLIKKDLQKEALPLRLQAYERISLFLERIKPSQLLLRVSPNSNDKADYETLLIANIEQEFEHNLSQQIYVTDKCWNITATAKNATIQMIRKATMSDNVDSADKVREVILTELMDKRSPSDAALSFIKEEVTSMWS